VQTKSEYYKDLVDRIFMRLEPTKMTIVNDGMFRDRLVVMTRAMVVDLERENDPESQITISELAKFADELAETIEQSCEELVLAPIAFVESDPSDGTIEWLKNLTDRLDENLVYPEMNLLLDIIDIIIDSPQENSAQIDSLFQANPALIGETFLEAIEIWTSGKIDELAEGLETNWDEDSILFVPIQIAGVMIQLSTRYRAKAWQVAIGCYELVADLEGDEEKLAMLADTIKTCRQALAAIDC
jgi:hypothetical protein